MRVLGALTGLLLVGCSSFDPEVGAVNACVASDSDSSVYPTGVTYASPSTPGTEGSACSDAGRDATSGDVSSEAAPTDTGGDRPRDASSQ
jgi:hypothetical protein